MLNVTRSQIQCYGMATLSVGLALLLTMRLGALIQPKVLILFFAAVAFSAWFGGLVCGLTATVLSVLAIAYFFTPPFYSLAISSSNDLFQLITFALVCCLVSALSADQRNSKRRAKAALVKLQASEERYRQITDTSYEGIWLLDANLRTEYANQRLADMLGYRLEEMQNRSLFDFMDQAGRDEAEYRIEQRKRGVQEQFDFRLRRKDGSDLWVMVSASPILNQQGEFNGTLTMLTDISDRKRSEDALRASEARFRRLFESNIIGINFGDFQGNILDANDAFLNLIGYTQTDLQAGRLHLEAITPPEYHLLDEQAASQSLSSACIPYEKEYIRKDGSRVSVLVAGARLADSNTGIGFVLDVTERKRIEQTLRYLAETSIDLATSLDYQTTLDRVAQIAVPAIADWCAVDLLNPDGTISRLPVAHADPAKAEWAKQLQHYPPNPQGEGLIAQVLATGQSILLTDLLTEMSEAQLEEATHDTRQLEIVRALNVKSVMVVPLIARQQILGTLTMATAESERRYGAADLSLAEDLARRAALAIDNARLYRATQAAQQATERTANRTARLQKITAALSEALTPHQVADVIVNQGLAALEATAGLVALLVQGMTVRIVSAIGYPSEVVQPWQTFPVTASTPLAKTVRTGEAIFLESAEALLADYPHLAEAIATSGNQAFVCIPLNAEGRTLGSMSLSFAQAQVFSEEDRAFMLTLGQQCAQAIARAQLYIAEQSARSVAETANRIKDEFLAVLSHELRTPLNPILGWTQMLKNRRLDEKTIARALDTIERNAKLQTQLIEDLLDVSRILQGKLRLTFCPVNLVSIIEAATETIRLAAEAKSIDLQFQVGLAGENQNSHQVSGNPARLQQIVWNLLSNAVKFTPDGGKVNIQLKSVHRAKDSAERFIDPAALNSAATDSAATDSAATDSAATDLVAAESVAPELTAPKLTAPELTAPKLTAPELTAPKLTAPDLTAPKLISMESRATESAAKLLVANALNSSVSDPSVFNLDALDSSALNSGVPSSDALFDANTANPSLLVPSLRSSVPTLSSYVQITVSDTGVGINPEFIPYVFDCFRQADSATTRKFGGLGLGLAIARYLVELHGGTIHADSLGEGKGATFTVRLPFWKEDRDKTQRKDSTGLYPTAHELDSSWPIAVSLVGVQALVVEDDADTLELLVFLLRQAGAVAIAASSAQEALQALEQVQPNILLSDIGMPEMDGYTLIEQIRQRSPQGKSLPAIALTAFAGEQDRQRAIAAGFQLHLAKPIEPQQLLEAIAHLMESIVP